VKIIGSTNSENCLKSLKYMSVCRQVVEIKVTVTSSGLETGLVGSSLYCSISPRHHTFIQ